MPWSSSPPSGLCPVRPYPRFPASEVARSAQQDAPFAFVPGHRVAFATAAQWVVRLADALHAGTLQAEHARLTRYPLLVPTVARCRALTALIAGDSQREIALRGYMRDEGAQPGEYDAR